LLAIILAHSNLCHALNLSELTHLSKANFLFLPCSLSSDPIPIAPEGG
jgi:hypothetical protein